MVGWHHQFNGHEFGWTPGVGDGQGDLACCSPWGHKESDMTEWMNWTELIHFSHPISIAGNHFSSDHFQSFAFLKILHSLNHTIYNGFIVGENLEKLKLKSIASGKVNGVIILENNSIILQNFQYRIIIKLRNSTPKGNQEEWKHINTQKLYVNVQFRIIHYTLKAKMSINW